MTPPMDWTGEEPNTGKYHTPGHPWGTRGGGHLTPAELPSRPKSQPRLLTNIGEAMELVRQLEATHRRLQDVEVFLSGPQAENDAAVSLSDEQPRPEGQLVQLTEYLGRARYRLDKLDQSLERILTALRP